MFLHSTRSNVSKQMGIPQGDHIVESKIFLYNLDLLPLKIKQKTSSNKNSGEVNKLNRN